MNVNPITVIIRSANERTLPFCRHLLTGMFPEDQIFIVEEVPFSAAIKKGLEIGVDQNRKWTMAIDADVLMHADGVADLFSRAESAPDTFFVIQGLILDKFFPIFRPSGIHFYRTALIKEALYLIPREGESVRPETDLLNNMAKIGFPWLQCDAIVGIHDFEQYYKDIFRKAFIQAHKHRRFIARAEDYWRDKQEKDQDFKVALWGSLLGKLHSDKVYIDKNFLHEQFEEVLSLKGIKEKQEPDELPEDIAKNTIANHNESCFEEFQNLMFKKELWNKVRGIQYSNTVESIKPNKNPIHKRVFNVIGNYLIMAGSKIKSD